MTSSPHVPSGPSSEQMRPSRADELLAPYQRHRRYLVAVIVAGTSGGNLAFAQLVPKRGSAQLVTPTGEACQRLLPARAPEPIQFRARRRTGQTWSVSAPVAVLAVAAAVRRRRPNRRQLGLSRCVQRMAAASPEPEPCPTSVSAGEMPPRYDFTSVEEDLYRWWENSGFFKPEVAESILAGPDGRQTYVLPMPPPNVTGRLHMGHAMFASLQDVLARFHRAKGDHTLWLPGTDHAGIATQMVVARQLEEQGLTRQGVGREAFLEHIWAWKAEQGGAIVEQLRRLGASADWTREQFTLNDHMSGAVIEAFVRLHEMGLIFRGQRMVNWSPVLQTAVSDLEVEMTERQGLLYHFKYVIAGSDGSQEYIPVATTRPETILGDAAVCVHPEDPRYQQFIGREVLVPMQGGRTIPVIADSYVDQEFGTGALKVTPAHDFNDFEIAERHGLPFHSIIGLDGSITKTVVQLGSPQYEGLDRDECRRKLWADMESEGLVLKTEDHVQRVPLSQRSGEVIEPLLSDQWFVRTEDMAQRAMDAVESGEIRIQPERYTKIWRGWLQEKQPWCISRQLWWGHRIPVYYPVGEVGGSKFYVARSMEEALTKARSELGEDIELEQDPDVLDTWFSSGLWPFATVGWPNESAADYQKFYPGTMLETGYDILFFWVARMVMMGLTLTDRVPFKEVYLHGLVRDENNQKMSKTKGNVVDPLDTIAEYGTDALRFALLTSVAPGMDVALSSGILDSGKSFANKIWNVGRFIITEYEKNREKCSGTYVTGMSFSEEEIRSMPWLERAIISRCHGVVESVTSALHENDFNPPTKALSDFMKNDFASWYVEASKTRLQDHLGGDPTSERAAIAQKVLLYVLDTTLRLLHPFMPFVTEAVWMRLPRGPDSPASLMVAPWANAGVGAATRDRQAEEWFAKVCSLVTQIRNARAEQGIAPKERVALTFWSDDAEFREALESERLALAWIARADAEEIKVEDIGQRSAGSAEGVVRIIAADGLEVDMPAREQTVDMEKELERLRKQLSQTTQLLESAEKKMTPQFMEKANPKAKEKLIGKAEDLRQQKAAIERQLEQLEQAQPSRRSVLAGLALSLALPRDAEANVAEGDVLPQGARQEDRIRKALQAWTELGEKFKKGEVKTKEDWDNTQGFLRRLYTVQEDMSYLAKGFQGTKKQEAEKLVEVFKKRVKAADKPAKAEDVETFMAMQVEITKYIDDFNDMLLDAPDEIDVTPEDL
eukprot:CAMPEP_0170575368 /NCGR_PEP_ID=MMETSP0224-20130122/3826_1 /TAXON_ID=285029 /ORGANISM="Togula jolla, Strain CCCM 725" /LENGTH=1232 /DNA_ID=CAMNT_0010898147 /DNA_START=1 /DNA_END=3699 /DNA_ORIENTATION=+